MIPIPGAPPLVYTLHTLSYWSALVVHAGGEVEAEEDDDDDDRLDVEREGTRTADAAADDAVGNEDDVAAARSTALGLVRCRGAYSVANCSHAVLTTSLHSASRLTNGRYSEKCTELNTKGISSVERPRDGRPGLMAGHFRSNSSNDRAGAIDGVGKTARETERASQRETERDREKGNRHTQREEQHTHRKRSRKADEMSD
jgi:hypothetical protein